MARQKAKSWLDLATQRQRIRDELGRGADSALRRGDIAAYNRENARIAPRISLVERIFNRYTENMNDYDRKRGRDVYNDPNTVTRKIPRSAYMGLLNG